MPRHCKNAMFLDDFSAVSSTQEVIQKGVTAQMTQEFRFGYPIIGDRLLLGQCLYESIGVPFDAVRQSW